MPVAFVAGRRVAWREAGSGAPALLLHCALAHSGAFAGLMDRLADRLAMRALDLPGHCGSGHDPSLGFQAQAADNARALLADGETHLVGHSFGATVALRLAVEDRRRVRSLTLIEPVMFGFLADAGGPAYAAEMAAQAPFRAAAAGGDWDAAADAFLGRWGSGAPGALPPAQAAYVRDRLPLVIAGEPDLLDGPARRLHLDDLDRLDLPVLLIEGAASPPVIAAILDAAAARLRAVRRVAVPGAGHMVPVSHAEAVAAAIRRHLEAAG